MYVSKIVQVLFEVQALGDFPGEEEEDLGFKDREILTILESRYVSHHAYIPSLEQLIDTQNLFTMWDLCGSRDDGWLLAENALGERGYIPSNYVQVCSKSHLCTHSIFTCLVIAFALFTNDCCHSDFLTSHPEHKVLQVSSCTISG